MELISLDGARVVLRPTGYQFGLGGASSDDWDANWLLVSGEVRPATGPAWSFHDPCLTTWECAELLEWLSAASRGQISPAATPSEDDGLLAFTEPNLAFSVAQLSGTDVQIRIHLSLESAPSELEPELDIYEYSVPLQMRRHRLLEAAEEWRTDISPFPER